MNTLEDRARRWKERVIGITPEEFAMRSLQGDNRLPAGTRVTVELEVFGRIPFRRNVRLREDLQVRPLATDPQPDMLPYEGFGLDSPDRRDAVATRDHAERTYQDLQHIFKDDEGTQILDLTEAQTDLEIKQMELDAQEALLRGNLVRQIPARKLRVGFQKIARDDVKSAEIYLRGRIRRDPEKSLGELVHAGGSFDDQGSGRLRTFYGKARTWMREQRETMQPDQSAQPKDEQGKPGPGTPHREDPLDKPPKTTHDEMTSQRDNEELDPEPKSDALIAFEKLLDQSSLGTPEAISNEGLGRRMDESLGFMSAMQDELARMEAMDPSQRTPEEEDRIISLLRSIQSIKDEQNADVEKVIGAANDTGKPAPEQTDRTSSIIFEIDGEPHPLNSDEPEHDVDDPDDGLEL